MIMPKRSSETPTWTSKSKNHKRRKTMGKRKGEEETKERYSWLEFLSFQTSKRLNSAIDTNFSILKVISLELQLADLLAPITDREKRVSLVTSFTQMLMRKQCPIEDMGSAYVTLPAIEGFTTLRKLTVDIRQNTNVVTAEANLRRIHRILKLNTRLEELTVKGEIPWDSKTLFRKFLSAHFTKLDLRDAFLLKHRKTKEPKHWFSEKAIPATLKDLGLPEISTEAGTENVETFVAKCQCLESLSFSVLQEKFSLGFLKTISELKYLKSVGSFGSLEWHCGNEILIPYLHSAKHQLEKLRLLIWYLATEDVPGPSIMSGIGALTNLKKMNITVMGGGDMSCLAQLHSLHNFSLTLIDTPPNAKVFQRIRIQKLLNEGCPKLKHFMINFWVEHLEKYTTDENQNIPTNNEIPEPDTLFIDRNLDTLSVSAIQTFNLSFGPKTKKSLKNLSFAGCTTVCSQELLYGCKALFKLDLDKSSELMGRCRMRLMKELVPRRCTVLVPSPFGIRTWHKTQESVAGLLQVISSYYTRNSAPNP